MNKVQYLHCSMEGSYYVNCEILEVKKSMYLIKYFDNIINDYLDVWTGKSKLKFPKFSDRII